MRTADDFFREGGLYTISNMASGSSGVAFVTSVLHESITALMPLGHTATFYNTYHDQNTLSTPPHSSSTLFHWESISDITEYIQKG
jgi:hypothetical protein